MVVKRGSIKSKKKSKKISKNKINSSIELTSSGCDMLDCALGGGFPWGKIINIVGDKSTGKTALAIETVVNAYYKLEHFGWYWNDAERGYSFPDKQIWGVTIITDPEEFSNTVEEWILHVRTTIQHFLEQGIPFIYVTDSLDALTTNDELKRAEERDIATERGEREKGNYKMEKAKLLSEFFRLLKGDISGSKCLFVIISQVRSNIGITFGKKHKRSGGMALDLYASQVIELSECEKIEETYKGIKRKVGVTIKAYISKNKIGKPFRECYFKILFDYGIDNIDSNICFLFDLIKNGKTPKSINIVFCGEKFKSRKELIKYIEKNNLESELKKACFAKWREIEEALSPHRKIKWEK